MPPDESPKPTKRWKLALFALCGALMGWGLVLLTYNHYDAVVVGLVIAAPVGAILGAIAGVIYLRQAKKRLPR